MIRLSGLANSMWVSDPIQCKSLFAEYVKKMSSVIKALKTCNVDNYDVELVSSIMGPILKTKKDQRGTNTCYYELISYCSEDRFDVPNEPCSLNVRRVTTRHSLFGRGKIPPPDSVGLATLKNLRQIGKDKESARGLKYSKIILINNERGDSKNLVVKKDVVISIRVHNTICPNETSIPPVKPFSQEILLLGCQTLTDLKDMILCSTDYTTSYSETENLVYASEEERDHTKRAKDIFKSGFFFIEDKFYNDLRDPANIDYSYIIRQWAKGKGIGPLHEGSMSERKLEDLTVRFGYPYVYQHQGNCEHIIVFHDARLLHESDVCDRYCYPLMTALGGKKPQDCMICHYYYARWMTFGNERVPVDPFYFCEECYKSYNYKDKKKIGEFKVYECHPFLPNVLSKVH